MNIFILDEDPIVAARYLCDRHVVKMALETAQILSTALVKRGGRDDRLYKVTHEFHPCTMWAERSMANFGWLVAHGLGVCDEYTRRYGKTHASEAVIKAAMETGMRLEHPYGKLTPFAQAMPENYRRPNAVEAYRAYYIGEKYSFATWKAPAETPSWWASN